jgi:glycosyltransferase involved in cell wall biosynthesis
MSIKTLYLCYFGLREPLVQTQVLPYLREINKLENVNVSLLTFEPGLKKNWTPGQIEIERKKLAAENIDWHCLPYHKRPSAPATLYDVFRGALFARKLIRRKQVNVLHARVHTPAMMGAIAKKLTGGKVKMIFDIRGFFPEEYTDAGIWKENGWLYKSVKKIEKWLLKESDGFVVLTEKAREILFPESRENGFDKYGRPVEVIPCCVDLKRFSPANRLSRQKVRENLGAADKKIITYVGSFGGWYMTDEMLDFFAAARARDANTFVLILTQRDVEKIVGNLKARGFADTDFFVGSVAPAEIPSFLEASDISISFIKACYSKLSSSPTKIAEYLASGVPIISNRGVGDVAEVIEAAQVGAIIEDFTPESYEKALQKVQDMGDLSEKCRLTAEREFHLEKVAGAKYRLLYSKLFGEDYAGKNRKISD